MQKKKADHWIEMDATDHVLGRFAARVAGVLLAKDVVLPHRPQVLSRHVVITNAEKITVTGKKEMQKRYYRHSGYPGGLKEETMEALRARKPEEILYHAVRGMLPKNRHGRLLLRRLHIYRGREHPHRERRTKSE